MVGAYALGFNSAIATTLNIYPELNGSILKNMQVGKVGAARNYQMKLNQCIQHITANGKKQKKSARVRLKLSGCRYLGTDHERSHELADSHQSRTGTTAFKGLDGAGSGTNEKRTEVCILIHKHLEVTHNVKNLKHTFRLQTMCGIFSFFLERKVTNK